MRLAGPCRSPQLQKDLVVPSAGGTGHRSACGSRGEEGVQQNEVLGGVWEQDGGRSQAGEGVLAPLEIHKHLQGDMVGPKL